MTRIQRKRSTISPLIPFLIIALVFGALLWNRYRPVRTPNPKPDMHATQGKRTVVLFFVDEGSRLAREARELDPCSDMADCVKDTLDELFYGPVGELDTAVPDGAVVNSVRIEGNTAVVDVSRIFVDEMPSGSSAEMMAVYSLVNTVCLNYPKITRVRLTVAGEANISLKHLDLSEALDADYTLEHPPPAGDKPSKPDTTKGKI